MHTAAFNLSCAAKRTVHTTISKDTSYTSPVSAMGDDRIYPHTWQRCWKSLSMSKNVVSVAFLAPRLLGTPMIVKELNVSNKLAAISVEEDVQHMALGYTKSML